VVGYSPGAQERPFFRHKKPKQWRLPSIIATSPTSIANDPAKIKNPFMVVSFVAMIMLIDGTLGWLRAVVTPQAPLP
jgi:hypothetical protein